MQTNKPEETQNQATDLRILQHPLVLFSIAMLLINDHVLKIYAPSWITGKISDFAGLFFFPILLSAILNIICKPLNLKQRHIAMGAFGFTALWFGLIKTLPVFSHLTEDFLSGLLSHPSQVIRDPSDLIALIILLPAWRLRTTHEKQPGPKNIKLSYLALCIASIATMATSPLPHYGVGLLTVYENTIYAKFDSSDSIFLSSDGGITWVEDKSGIPAQVTASLNEDEFLETLCLPSNFNICYRTESENIVESFDRGKTWSTSWSIPVVQKRFLRYASPYIDLYPRGLFFLEYDGKQVLISSMGNAGVLVKTGDEPWKSIGVNGFGPITNKGPNLGDAIGIVLTEIMIISLISTMLLIFNVLVNIKRIDNEYFTYLLITAMTPVLLFFGFFAAIYLPAFAIISAVILIANALIAAVLAFNQLLTNMNKHSKAGLIMLIMVWLTSCTLYILWVYDIIHENRTALITVIILNMGYLAWLLWRIILKVSNRFAKNT